MEDLLALEARLELSFNDYSLLSRALTHRSYLNENPGAALEDNERLEVLGDAVLDFLVGDYLYHHLPEAQEGELTALRAALVRTEALADLARALELGPVLRLGYGEDESGGRRRTPILCASFEALVGAIYLDQGLDTVQALLERLLPQKLEHILAQSLHKDSKSEFQIWAQGIFNITPTYEVIAASGPDHDKTFTVQAMIDDKVWGVGMGSSKQIAAQSAATIAMEAARDYEDSQPEPG
jgi:ribonuclease-3